MSQLLLDLPMRAALNRADFLVAPCNAEAVALIDNWQSVEQRIIYVYGASGCGKSHLVAVLENKFAAMVVPAADIAHHQAVQDCLNAEIDVEQVLVLENLETLNPRDEEVLFHLLNAVRYKQNVRVLMTANIAPNHLDIRLADLRSRMGAVLAVAMGDPCDDLLARLLTKLFCDRQLSIDEKLIAYLLPRMERDYTAMRELVIRIDRAALTDKRDITIPFVAKLLEADC